MSALKTNPRTRSERKRTASEHPRAVCGRATASAYRSDGAVAAVGITGSGSQFSIEGGRPA
jgi:hypothetical protein